MVSDGFDLYHADMGSSVCFPDKSVFNLLFDAIESKSI